jgi:hypothetical protein
VVGQGSPSSRVSGLYSTDADTWRRARFQLRSWHLPCSHNNRGHRDDDCSVASWNRARTCSRLGGTAQRASARAHGAFFLLGSKVVHVIVVAPVDLCWLRSTRDRRSRAVLEAQQDGREYVGVPAANRRVRIDRGPRGAGEPESASGFLIADVETPGGNPIRSRDYCRALRYMQLLGKIQ